jgi:hypothetical protein
MLPSIKRLAARLIARLQGRSDEQRRKRILSNLDWVIQMLHQVHEDTPEAGTEWWDGMRDAVLDDRAAKVSKTNQTKAS